MQTSLSGERTPKTPAKKKKINYWIAHKRKETAKVKNKDNVQNRGISKQALSDTGFIQAVRIVYEAKRRPASRPERLSAPFVYMNQNPSKRSTLGASIMARHTGTPPEKPASHMRTGSRLGCSNFDPAAWEKSERWPKW